MLQLNDNTEDLTRVVNSLFHCSYIPFIQFTAAQKQECVNR